jgi:hypothetical protein
MLRLNMAENGARIGDAQRLGEATGAVYCALATPPGAALAPDPAVRNAANWQMVLAELPRQIRPEALSRWRGRIDSLAFRRRYSDPVCYARFEPRQRTERTLYSLLEQVRVELLAGREFPGARQNLGSLAHERWLRSRPESMLRSCWCVVRSMRRCPSRRAPACARAGAAGCARASRPRWSACASWLATSRPTRASRCA